MDVRDATGLVAEGSILPRTVWPHFVQPRPFTASPDQGSDPNRRALTRFLDAYQTRMGSQRGHNFDGLAKVYRRRGGWPLRLSPREASLKARIPADPSKILQPKSHVAIEVAAVNGQREQRPFLTNPNNKPAEPVGIFGGQANPHQVVAVERLVQPSSGSHDRLCASSP